MFDPVAPFHIKPRPSVDLLSWLVRFARAATRERVSRAAPLLRDLCLASRTAYEELAARGCDFGLVKEGLLLVCRTADAWRHEMASAAYARELGIPAEVHAGSDALALEPSLRKDIAGVVDYSLDCHLAPHRLMACLEQEVEKRGGQLVWSTEIVGWRCDAGRVLAAKTRNGDDIEADEFVLCGGAWSPQASRELGLSLPMQAGKGYSLTLPSFDRVPRHCAILAEARVAVTPMNGGLRIGGTMELAGLDRSINAPRVQAIIDAVSRYYAQIGPDDFAHVTPWSGLRPCTPDGLPYIGRTRKQSNLTVAAGHAMMGVTLAAVTGNIVATVLAGEAPPYDMTLLSPDRYS
jgi:D-amino-acid dehydrogenase